MIRRCPARPGFSLFEVMVAVVVMGIVGLSYATIQRQNVGFVEDVFNTWDHMNFAQQYLTRYPPGTREVVEYSQTWIPWEDDKELLWKVDPGTMEDIEAGEAYSEDSNAVVLRTKIRGTIMSWEWIER